VFEDADLLPQGDKLQSQVMSGAEKGTEPIIGSNTSAVPITILQQGMAHPNGFWAFTGGNLPRPCCFMEIICGDQTDPRFAERARQLAQGSGKSHLSCTATFEVSSPTVASIRSCGRPSIWWKQATPQLKKWMALSAMITVIGSRSPGPFASWILPAFRPVRQLCRTFSPISTAPQKFRP